MLRSLLPLLLLTLLCWLPVTPPAAASIHTYPEAEGRTMVRSLQTLRDSRDRAWQLVFFQRRQPGQVLQTELRLVGFPGLRLSHPQALMVRTGFGQQWQAPDDFGIEPNLTANVGQYDLAQVITALEGSPALELELPEDRLQLTVPPFIVREWQRLTDTPS